MKRMMLSLLPLILAIPLVAQQDDGEKVVSVPKKYVSAEGLNHQASPPSAPQQVSQWVGVGKEVGTAVREGLDAVVDKAEKFGTTKVGTFVMVMIAWKIMAREVLGVVLGIPMLIAGVCVWVYIAKRLFFGYRVLAKHEGKEKVYEDHPPYSFAGKDARTGVGWAMGLGLFAFTVLMCFVIF